LLVDFYCETVNGTSYVTTKKTMAIALMRFYLRIRILKSPVLKDRTCTLKTLLGGERLQACDASSRPRCFRIFFDDRWVLNAGFDLHLGITLFVLLYLDGQDAPQALRTVGMPSPCRTPWAVWVLPR
jgi:hypothetical protein